MIASIISKLHTEEDAPRSPVPSAAGRSPTARGPVAKAVNHPPYEHTHNNLSSMAASDDEEKRAAISTSSSIEAVAEQRLPGSERGSGEDVAELSASASEHRLVEQTANQGDTEVPIGYESIST